MKPYDLTAPCAWDDGLLHIELPEPPTAIHVHHPGGSVFFGVPIGAGQERKAFEAGIENMRLLGIVRTLAYCVNDRADCDACTMNGVSVGAVEQCFCDGMADMLRELGIEVKQ